ncbi:MAG: hypothetical protein R3F20_05515 [Planctomycetota bacterium]
MTQPSEPAEPNSSSSHRIRDPIGILDDAFGRIEKMRRGDELAEAQEHLAEEFAAIERHTTFIVTFAFAGLYAAWSHLESSGTRPMPTAIGGLLVFASALIFAGFMIWQALELKRDQLDLLEAASSLPDEGEVLVNRYRLVQSAVRRRHAFRLRAWSMVWMSSFALGLSGGAVLLVLFFLSAVDSWG